MGALRSGASRAHTTRHGEFVTESLISDTQHKAGCHACKGPDLRACWDKVDNLGNVSGRAQGHGRRRAQGAPAAAPRGLARRGRARARGDRGPAPARGHVPPVVDAALGRDDAALPRVHRARHAVRARLPRGAQNVGRGRRALRGEPARRRAVRARHLGELPSRVLRSEPRLHGLVEGGRRAAVRALVARGRPRERRAVRRGRARARELGPELPQAAARRAAAARHQTAAHRQVRARRRPAAPQPRLELRDLRDRGDAVRDGRVHPPDRVRVRAGRQGERERERVPSLDRERSVVRTLTAPRRARRPARLCRRGDDVGGRLLRRARERAAHAILRRARVRGARPRSASSASGRG